MKVQDSECVLIGEENANRKGKSSKADNLRWDGRVLGLLPEWTKAVEPSFFHHELEK